ncbi:hypothetical protein BH20ACT23_BH20ACT23_01710 [soil metagenome]
MRPPAIVSSTPATRLARGRGDQYGHLRGYRSARESSAFMRKELKRVRDSPRRQAPEERDLPALPTSARRRADEVAALLTRINQLVG